MKVDKLDKFKLITYQNIDIDERNVVTLLYQPLIGSDAFSLYLTLWALIDRSRLKTPKYHHSKLFDLIKISPSSFLKNRKKLEAIGLLVVYQNEDLLLYELKAPLSAEEFIKDGSLGAYLFSEIGKANFDEIISLFKINSVEKSGFKNITTTFDEIFESIPEPLQTDDSFINRSKSKITINNDFNFDIFFEGLSKNFVDHRKITSRVKEKISRLSYVYNLDEFTMQKVFMDAVGKDKTVNLDLLSKRAGYWFNFEKKTDKVKLQEKGKPKKEVESEHLSNEESVELCKTSNPLDILSELFGSKPAAVELKIIERLLENSELTSELINFLIVYVVTNTDGFPSYNYFEKIAVDWHRRGFTTIEETSKYIKSRGKRQTNRNVRQKNLLPKDIESDWLDEYIKNF